MEQEEAETLSELDEREKAKKESESQMFHQNKIGNEGFGDDAKSSLTFIWIALSKYQNY